MSMEKFDDDCPGCRPVILDPETMNPLPGYHPIVMAVEEYWSHTTREERQAFHRFCCLNSRAPEDMAVVGRMNKAMGEACKRRNQ